MSCVGMGFSLSVLMIAVVTGGRSVGVAAVTFSGPSVVGVVVGVVVIADDKNFKPKPSASTNTYFLGFKLYKRHLLDACDFSRIGLKLRQ